MRAEDRSMPKSPPAASYVTARRWSVAEARSALAALASSGLSASAFAARAGFNVQRLHSWRRKFATAPAQESTPRFVEFRPPAVERVEIVLRSGRVLRVSESIDPAAVVRLVEALERSSPSSC
jgi:transposase-like protein